MSFHVTMKISVKKPRFAGLWQDRRSGLVLILGELVHVFFLTVGFHKPVKALARHESEPLTGPGLPKQSFLDPAANGLRCCVADSGDGRNLDPLGANVSMFVHSCFLILL